MKTSFLCIHLCLATCCAYAQSADSLALEIKNLKSTGVVLKYFGQDTTTFRIEGNILKPSSNSFRFKVTTDQNAAVVIRNTEVAGGNPDTLQLNHLYTVENDAIQGTSFQFQKNVSIEILNKATLASIKKYQLVYNKEADAPGPRPLQLPNPTGYKIGSPIHDAMFIRKGASNLMIQEILSYYANGLRGEDLRREYQENKFLDSLAMKSVAGQQGAINFGSIISSIGGLDVTTLADGAAKFIVKRAKQELSMAFFQRFKTVIDSTKDIGTVFPQTANLLTAIDERIYDYENYIQNLREAFKQDIVEVHRNLPGIIDNHPGYFSRHQVLKSALLSACYTAQQLEDQAHPGDIIANYPIDYLDSVRNKNYKGAIQVIQLLSASLRDTSANNDGGYWVNIKQMRELVNDKLALKIFLGLMYQEAKHKFGGISLHNTSLLTLLNTVAVHYNSAVSIYNSYRSYVLRFGEKLDAVNKMIKTVSKETSTDSATIEKYAKYFRTTVDLLDYCTEASRLPVIKDHVPDLPALLNRYFEVSYAVTDLVVDVARRNYSAVINHAVHVYDLVVVRSSREMPDNIAFGLVPKSSGDTGGSQLSVNETAVVSDYDSTVAKNTLRKLLRYGSFMATVATAKTSDEVQYAIEAAALPVGSSRIKRASDFNVSLNAYAGLFYGVERINDVDSGSWKANVYGVTAPLGVAASWGHRAFFIPTGTTEWSTTLFVSLIDLGAVAAFRFTDDSTSQIPSIKLKHIFSPGAFLSIGIPRTPLSFNLGAQMGPNLRKVNVDQSKGNDFDDKIYWRFSASFCVDIPIVNFHTRSN